jgi:hypothetical protein
VQRDVADDTVTLVEDGEDRDPLRHRGNARLIGRRRFARGPLLVLLLHAAVAGGERECDQ